VELCVDGEAQAVLPDDEVEVEVDRPQGREDLVALHLALEGLEDRRIPALLLERAMREEPRRVSSNIRSLKPISRAWRSRGSLFWWSSKNASGRGCPAMSMSAHEKSWVEYVTRSERYVGPTFSASMNGSNRNTGSRLKVSASGAAYSISHVLKPFRTPTSNTTVGRARLTKPVERERAHAPQPLAVLERARHMRSAKARSSVSSAARSWLQSCGT
jgi:hypothetical protein